MTPRLSRDVVTLRGSFQVLAPAPLIWTPRADGDVSFGLGLKREPPGPMFPKRHLIENRSLIFRRLFQTTKNPEVWTVTGFCGLFQTLPKNCGLFLKFWDFCSVAVEPRYFAVGAYALTLN